MDTRPPTLVGPAERLRLFVQARDVVGPGLKKQKRVLLVETDRRLIVLSATHEPIEEHALDRVSPGHFEKNLMWGSKLLLFADNAERRFTQVVPFPEGHRLLDHLGGETRRTPDGLSEVPMTPPIAHFANMSLYEDRLQAGEEAQIFQWPISSGVSAEVDTAGNLAATRGRRLGVKAGATLLLGPLGLLFGGPRDYITDSRELYLLVEGPNWAYSAAAPPDWGLPARRFAQLVNVLAKSSEASSAEAATPAAEQDRLVRLKMLGELRDNGTLTNKEFEAEKAKILEAS